MATDDDASYRKHLVRAVIASTVGSTIEWYDFFLYSTVTGLVFAKLYFPQSEPLTGTLEAFAVYAVGFVARPIGAAIFGHFGDRIGRRRTLIITLTTMGLATFAIALVPSYVQIGMWGAALLTLFRFIQGIGVGGDWGGAVLLSMEWAQTNKHRGFIASWPQFGVPMGLFLANLAVLACGFMPDAAFLQWGWRLPFVLSLLLLAVGLYVRLGALETPVFRRLVLEQKVEKQPIVEVLRRQPREVVLSALARMGQQAPFYVFTAFVFSYATTVVHASRNFLLLAVLTASVISFFTVPAFGHLSDRIGRKTTYVAGLALTGLFSILYFALIDTGVSAWIFVAIATSLITHDMAYGPQAAFIAENFTESLRYSGASMGYQLASVIAGGPAPLIATAVFAQYHSGYAVVAYLVVCAVISIAASLLMTDRTNRALSGES
jgi:MFS family permease